MLRFITLKIKNKVKLQNVDNKINKDENIKEQYKEFLREFRNIPGIQIFYMIIKLIKI